MPGKILKSFATVSLVTFALAGLTSPGLGAGGGDHTHDHSAHTGVYKDRAETMKAMAGAAKANGAMFKGEVTFDLAKVQANGKLIAEKAHGLAALFPEGTNAEDSEALDIIWQDFADFTNAADLLAKRAAVLAHAPDPKAAGAAFGSMLKACGGCHEVYRVKKEDRKKS